MESLYTILLLVEFCLALPIFILLFFVKAPYGKFLQKGWGPSVGATTAWIFMELPAFMLPLLFFLFSGKISNPVYLIFIGIWQLHYIQRTFVYPVILNKSSHKVPFLIILFSLIFNAINGWVNGYGVFFKLDAGVEWLYSPRFIIGCLIFLLGFIINLHSDYILRNLRAPGETEYKIPNKGLFKYVSSPHYLGEILEWAGWALLTWSPAGAAFLLFSMANLVPRAVTSLKWYRKTFPEYPSSRKALIPFIF
jgi:3-oxo-5-alpha-steroid 4-dehydrogenase 1